MQTKFKNIFIKVSQRIVYLILQKLLNYLKINKLKGYDKLIIEIFTEVYYPYKCIQIAMSSNRDFLNTIIIIIAFNILYKDFNITIISFLEIRNQIIDKIKSIL